MITPKEKALAITPGTWEHRPLMVAGRKLGIEILAWREPFERRINSPICTTANGFAHQDEDAILICDAGTTYNSCQMLPSEMLEKLRKCAWELEKARQELVSCKHYVSSTLGMEIVDDRITRIELFLSTLDLPKP